MSGRSPISHHNLKWWRSRICLVAILVVVSLTSSVQAGHQSDKYVILPNPKLIGCKTSNCPEMLPDHGADSKVVYPWQVIVDFTDGGIMGLTALYDQPTTMDEVKAAIDERYGKWAFPAGSSDRLQLWRIEPEKFVINLSVNDDGMVQVIYLIFDPKHPLSDPVRKKFLDRLDATHPDGFTRKMIQNSLTPQSR